MAATTLCNSCGKQIGYRGATICPYCGKGISKTATTAIQPESGIRDAGEIKRTDASTAKKTGAGAQKFAGQVSAVPPDRSPAVPVNASKGVQQLRQGLDRLLRAMKGPAGLMEFELAIGEISVALALLRASDGWDLAEAGAEEVLREFLAYSPPDDARGRRIRDLQQRLRGWFGEKPSSEVTEQRNRISVQPTLLRTSPRSLLTLVDAWTLESFELDRLGAGQVSAPTFYCESLEEFYGSFFAFRNLSPEEQARGVSEETQQARAVLEAGGGGVLGVNWPGKGCYLNGEAFAHMHGKSSAAEALRCPKTFPNILTTAVHEKLGHGWLAEHTTRGREIRTVHLEQHEVARHFLRRTSDDPRDVLLQDKWNILLATSKYSEEGYSTWLESKALAVAASRLARGEAVEERGIQLEAVSGFYHRDRILSTLEQAGGDLGVELAQAMSYVLDADAAERGQLAALMSGVFPHTSVSLNTQERDEAYDQLCSELFGQPLHYVFGCLLINRLEQTFGERSVPFALALAGNVSYGLESVSNADLRVAMDSNPQLRMDVRLCLLGTLEGVPHNNPDALYEAARRELSLTPPKLLPKKASH